MKIERNAGELPRNMITLLVRFGDEFTLTQRFGYAVISLFLFLFGLEFAVPFVPEVREGDLFGLFWIAFALLPLALGIAGIVNVLRFPKSKTWS